ncbi:MAG: hypothetical protein DWB45_04950 [Xanthomonadales bacterium]|nr:hypothetical protein [Xanthomonadales bacterium]MDL1869076.1 hypothetical protein [Gammaproteobacteria bacterium PRO6]
MARKTLAERRSEKLDELERIKSDLARIEERAAMQIGKLAVRAGLADLDIEDEQLAKEFAAVAAKFQSRSGKKDKPASPNAASASQN